MDIYMVEISWYVDAEVEDSKEFIVTAHSVAEALSIVFNVALGAGIDINGNGSFHIHGPYTLSEDDPCELYRF